MIFRGGFFGLFVFLFFVCLLSSVSSLGVTPAKSEINFEPNLEKEFTFHIIESDSNQEFEIYVIEDLVEYVTLDKTTIVGDGYVTATLKLPFELNKPGKYRILIGVRQKVDPELIQGNIGTAVAIQVPIYVNVPFPGRYIDITLKAQDVNVGEPVNFEINLKSEGDQEVTVLPRIDIFNQREEFVESLLFQPRVIQSQESLDLKKTLDTTKYNPGNYKARAIADYGDISTDEKYFRIGELFIDILGYTDEIPILNRLEQFDIGIKSGWNDNIDGVFAEVVFSNFSGKITDFKTTTASLVPWEEKNISGFFDTSSFSEGVYDANITLKYFGKERGETTNKIVKVSFVHADIRNLLIWYLIGGLGILIMVVIFSIEFFNYFKNGRNKKIKKK